MKTKDALKVAAVIAALLVVGWLMERALPDDVGEPGPVGHMGNK
jgi:hypothetical protein